MAKKQKFSQKTNRPRIKSLQAVSERFTVQESRHSFYRSWASIRHLCKRDGLNIYLTANVYRIILENERMNAARLELVKLGFSFQFIAF